MKTFQLSTLLRILEAATDKTQTILGEEFFQAFDPSYANGVISPGLINKLMSGERSLSKDTRRKIREVAFEEHKQGVVKHLIPLLREAQLKKVTAAVKLTLNDDENIDLDIHIGPNNNSFTKNSIITTDSLSFLELLTGALYYVAVNTTEGTKDTTELRNYINDILNRVGLKSSLVSKMIENKSPSDNECSVQENLASFTSTISPSNNVQINIRPSEIADIEYTNSPTTITEGKLRLGMKIGYNLADLMWVYNDHEDSRRNVRMDIVVENISGDCQLIYDSYGEFQQSIMTYYKDDVEYYVAISIGIYLERLEKLQKVSHNNDEDKETQKYLKKLVKNNIQGIKNDIPSSIISDKQKFLSFIDSIKRLPIPTQFEYICLFFNCDDDVKKDDDGCYIRQIIDLLYTENKNLEEAKSYVMFFLKENQLTANRKATKTLHSLLDILESISQEEYDLRMKYNVWPESSTWGSEEAFENICIGIIEEIIKKTNNRAEAISLSETSLKMCKIFGKEKDIQVYNKVIYEFHLASEEEVTILRNQILQI